MQTSSKSSVKYSSSAKASGKAKAASTARAKNPARDLVEVLVLVLVIFLGIKLSFESRPIDGTSMQPNFFTGQLAFVNKLDYLFNSPQRGDVIIFHYPNIPSEIYIKRIIGLPGDTVTITPTTVAVDGVTLKEPYISSPDNCSVAVDTGSKCQASTTVKLGPNQFWVMGDNRPVSADSRVWGVLDRSFIIGKASFVWWPLSQVHAVDMHHDVFAKVPNRGMTQSGDPGALVFFAPLGAAALRARRVIPALG